MREWRMRMKTGRKKTQRFDWLKRRRKRGMRTSLNLIEFSSEIEYEWVCILYCIKYNRMESRVDRARENIGIRKKEKGREKGWRKEELKIFRSSWKGFFVLKEENWILLSAGVEIRPQTFRWERWAMSLRRRRKKKRNPRFFRPKSFFPKLIFLSSFFPSHLLLIPFLSIFLTFFSFFWKKCPLIFSHLFLLSFQEYFYSVGYHSLRAISWMRFVSSWTNQNPVESVQMLSCLQPG